MSADVAGYSRLISEDEAAIVKTLNTYREIMAALIKQHRGRVVDSPGVNVLAEFASVVDGVQCAVSVQNEFQARNAELPENRRMEFCIGINLGDVIEEGDRIYGDGVNIAARLEQHPDFSIEAYIKQIKRAPFKDHAFLDRQIEIFRKAGIPEKSPK
jgi:adenylate cyclase